MSVTIALIISQIGSAKNALSTLFVNNGNNSYGHMSVFNWFVIVNLIK